jgi:hypothetical protein
MFEARRSIKGDCPELCGGRVDQFLRTKDGPLVGDGEKRKTRT